MLLGLLDTRLADALIEVAAIDRGVHLATGNFIGEGQGVVMEAFAGCTNHLVSLLSFEYS